MRTISARLTLCFLLAVSVALPARAADLIEPWERGFSNVEFFTARTSSAPRTQLNGLIGFGLPGGLSLGTAVSSDSDGTTRLGLVGYYTFALGSLQELDLFAELGKSDTPEAELNDEGDWLAGLEWSRRGRAATLYMRSSHFGGDGDHGWHPLLGLMLPYGERLELHMELSSESPDEGSWPVHLAVGPNVRLTDRVEFLPELSLVHHRQDDGSDWRFSFGFVIDPRRRAASPAAPPPTAMD